MQARMSVLYLILMLTNAASNPTYCTLLIGALLNKSNAYKSQPLLPTVTESLRLG